MERETVFFSEIDIPILFLHGAEDELVPPEECDLLYAATASANKKKRIIPGIDHNIPLHKGREAAFDEAVAWFKEYL
jgi:fermentation-respiration switch protein FrsA (DUF1100 family)